MRNACQLPSILLVDDQASVRAFIRQLLTPLGARIDAAENGQDALVQIQKKSFDLVITDYQMPIMDGLSFCEKLKEDTACRAIPVVILSEFNSSEIISKGFDAGANTYISRRTPGNSYCPLLKKILPTFCLNKIRSY